MVTSLENLNAAKNFVCENFHVQKWREQFRGTRKISVSADIKDIWEAVVGETLVCALEPNSSRDRNAAAIVAAGTFVLTTVHMDLVEACQQFDPLA